MKERLELIKKMSVKDLIKEKKDLSLKLSHEKINTMVSTDKKSNKKKQLKKEISWVETILNEKLLEGIEA